MIKSVIGVILVVVVIGLLLPQLLPLMFDTDTDVQSVATNATFADVGAPLLGDIWPIMMIVIVLGIAAGLVFFALRRFNVLK